MHSCENIVLWRGHFNATGAEKSLNLSVNGGEGETCFLVFSNQSAHLLSYSIRCQCLAEQRILKYVLWKVCKCP